MKVTSDVSLDRKELDDLIIDATRKQLDKPGAGTAKIEYLYDTEDSSNLRGVVVTFQAVERA